MHKWLLIVLIVLMAMALVLGGAIVWLLSRPGPQPFAAPPSIEVKSSPNVTAYVHQSAVNDMLAAMFPFEGEGKLLKKPISISYNWKVENPHVEITSEGPIFSAKAKLHILGKTYEIAAQSNADVRYDSSAQELYMDLHGIQTHTDAKVLGIPLDKLNIAPANLNILLLRHLPLLVPFKVKKPMEVQEEVRFAILGHRVRYEKGRAIVDFTVDFKELSQGKEVVGNSQKPQVK